MNDASGRYRSPTPIPVTCDFPVTWDNEEEPTLLWTWDEFHAPLPRTPMTQSVSEFTRRGMTRATRETGRYTPGGLRKIINGYPYSATRPYKPTLEERQDRQARIDRAIRDARRRWDEEWLPRLERDIAEMKAVDFASLDDHGLRETVDRFLELHTDHWYLHHLVVMPTIEAADRLEKRYEAIVGPMGKEVAHRLLHGAVTKTAQSIREMDALAEEAARSDLIRSALAVSKNARELAERLTGSIPGETWLASFGRYMGEYGYRCAGFDLMYPTWLEDPAFVIQNLRARMSRDGLHDAWVEQGARLSADRTEMLRRVRDRLAGDPVRMAEFEWLYATAQALWPLKEDHSHYIDQASLALVRIAFAEVGRRLARRRLIARPDDIWFLTADEARATFVPSKAVPSPDRALSLSKGEGETPIGDIARPAADVQALVIQRRADHVRWSQLRPPKHLGTYPADYEGEKNAIAPDITEMRELRGAAASPGEATGVAVIVMSPDDFGKVRPGNILVCRSTAPMWTPLFQVVAGLVSEAGGILSHPAVVAREFGLPAVVGIRGATSLIKDGQLVTVSGGSGLVRLGD